MQNAALAELGLGETWSYEAIEVEPEGFEELVRSLPGAGFAGVNVTLPHKEAALALADRASAAATAIGAANTLSFGGGEVAAENTDAPALIEALPRPAAGVRALVMGAGGSARACAWALREAGAEVAIWNRTAERGRALAAELGVADAGSADVEAGDYELLVNATTVGLAEANAENPPAAGDRDLKGLPLDADAVGERHVVVDLVYGPHATPLAASAQSRGAQVVDGLEILVRQGAASLRIWTGAEPPVEVMRRAARENQS